MGTWEVGIYQNDLSADVKDDYISKLKAGKSDEQALAEMLDEYKEEADDIDCKKNVSCIVNTAIIGGRAY